MNSDIDHLEELCTPRIYSAIEYERELGGFEDVRYLLGEDAAPEIHTLESYVHERSFGRIEKIAVNTFITTRLVFFGVFFLLCFGGLLEDWRERLCVFWVFCKPGHHGDDDGKDDGDCDEEGCHLTCDLDVFVELWHGI